MSKTDTLILIALTWAVAAYIIAPKLWAMYFRRHPDFTNLDRCTKTGDGHPGDPINIVLAGDEAELQRAMTALALSWRPDLYIFDEPMAARDGAGEGEELAAMRRAVM
mgnify:CR=1 FL=1